MEKNRENDEITIDLAELFTALWNKIHIIVLAGVAAYARIRGNEDVHDTDVHIRDSDVCTVQAGRRLKRYIC